MVERLRDEVFHLVVLDQTMPKLTGLDLLAQIRAFDDDIAVIMTTVTGSLETAAASIPHGVSAYIGLPLQLEGFRDTIAWIMEKKGFVPHREDKVHAAIGRKIRNLRKARRLTLKQMAQRTNVSASLLSQIELAKSSASVSILFKVATVLEVRFTDLFDGY